MSVRIGGQTYYRTSEVCHLVGISKTTFFRWLREGIVHEAGRRDRRGWRLFTEDEVNRWREEVNRAITSEVLQPVNMTSHRQELPVGLRRVS